MVRPKDNGTSFPFPVLNDLVPSLAKPAVRLTPLLCDRTGTSSRRLPHVSKKTDLHLYKLCGDAVFLVRGVLSATEAGAIVAAAEAIGFQQQGSKGPAHGEVRSSRVHRDSDMRAPDLCTAACCLHHTIDRTAINRLCETTDASL